jgi:molybdopterin-binding protein
VIQVEAASVRLGTFALEAVSLEVPAGRYAVVIGPSGSGKSTLLEAIAGHVRLTSGRIILDGRDATALAPEQRSIGVVYQHYHLFPHLSVRQNIGYGVPRTEDRRHAAERVTALAERLGIAGLLERGVTDLSGGERQRVALARALAPRPRLLLLDEPFAAVDPSTRRTLYRELFQLHRDEQTTTLQVTHDFEDALRLGDQVAVLSRGRVVQQGAPDEVFQEPNSPFVADFVGAGNVIHGEISNPTGSTERPFVGQFRAGGLVLEVRAEQIGPGYALIRPEEILLTTAPLAGPPRNQFSAVVERIEQSGNLVSIHLDAGIPLRASILPETLGELGLRPGQRVTAGIKATAIRLF